MVDAYPLTGFQLGSVLAGGADRTDPAVRLTVVVPGGDPDRVLRRVRDLYDRHAALRTRLDPTHPAPLQLAPDPDPAGAGPAVELRPGPAAGELTVELTLPLATLDPTSARLLAADLLAEPADRSTGGAGRVVAGTRDLLAVAVPAGPELRAAADLVAEASPTGDPDAAHQASGRLDGPLTDRLRAVAGELRVPLDSVLLAAHLWVVGRLTGRAAVGSWLVADARAALALPDGTTGEFRVTLPVTADRGVPTWRHLVSRAHRSAGLADRLPALVSLAPDGRGSLLEVRAGDGAAPPLPGYRYRGRPLTPYAVVVTAAGDGLAVAVTHRDGDAELALDCFRQALADLSADPTARPDTTLRPRTTPQPTPAGTVAGGGVGALVAGSALERIFEWAGRADAAPVAVRDPDGGQLSYRELRGRVLALADRLVGAGVRPEQAVGVFLPRSVDLVVAMLAVQAAGAAVLPLDVEYPVERGAQALADAGAVLLLTAERAGPGPRFAGPVWRLDGPDGLDGSDGLGGSAGDGERAGRPAIDRRQVAYTLFTSGSTGRPKGVDVSHAALANLVRFSADRLGLGPADRVAQRTPVAFDAGLWEIFAPLACGATVVVLPPAATRDPAVLAGELDRHRITVLQMVPSLVGAHLEAGVFDRAGALRLLLCGGEALPAALCRRFAERAAARLVNVYGPTECAVDATWWPVSDVAGGVPIGGPVPGVVGYALDELGQPSLPYVPGELHLGGAQLARGYRGRPGMTADRFVPDHLGGAPGARLYRTGDRVRALAGGGWEYLGRDDGQVKVRGVRAELGEVEQALADCPGVRAAAVTVDRTSPGEVRLVAHVVTDDPALPGQPLRDRLARVLPDAMIPAGWRRHDALPSLPSGKVDRRRLAGAAAGPAGTPFHAPLEERERLLAAHCAAVLGVDAVGRDDDLAALGLDRRRALWLGALIRRDLPIVVGAGWAPAARTVAELARTVHAAKEAA
jgi:amino acid adenylation domain-containing protein